MIGRLDDLGANIGGSEVVEGRDLKTEILRSFYKELLGGAAMEWIEMLFQPAADNYLPPRQLRSKIECPVLWKPGCPIHPERFYLRISTSFADPFQANTSCQ